MRQFYVSHTALPDQTSISWQEWATYIHDQVIGNSSVNYTKWDSTSPATTNL